MRFLLRIPRLKDIMPFFIIKTLKEILFYSSKVLRNIFNLRIILPDLIARFSPAFIWRTLNLG